VIISKINFKKSKNYFDAFPNEKHIEKKLLPQYQTSSNNVVVAVVSSIFHSEIYKINIFLFFKSTSKQFKNIYKKHYFQAKKNENFVQHGFYHKNKYILRVCLEV
jgi:hypothetical protein